MTPQQRRAVIRALWTQHVIPNRTEADVIKFHQLLKSHRPDLLIAVRKGEDPLQPLRSALAGLYSTQQASD